MMRMSRLTDSLRHSSNCLTGASIQARSFCQSLSGLSTYGSILLPSAARMRQNYFSGASAPYF